MADIEKITPDIIETMKQDSMNTDELLKSIDQSLKSIRNNINDISDNPLKLNGSGDVRSNRNRTSRESDSDDYSARSERWKPNRDGKSRSSGNIFDDAVGSFLDSFEKQVFGESFSDMISQSMSQVADTIADAFGGPLEEVGLNFGDMAGKALGNMVKDNPFVKQLTSEIKDVQQSLANRVNDAANHFSDTLKQKAGLAGGEGTETNFAEEAVKQSQEFGKTVKNAAGNVGDLGDTLKNANIGDVKQIGTKLVPAVKNAAGELGPMAANAAKGALQFAKLHPAMIAVTAALFVFDKLTEVVAAEFRKIKEAAVNFGKAMDEASKRTQSMLGERLSNKMKRIAADTETMIRASYEVMEKASQEMLDSWDRNLTTITATQGYTKEATQDMISNMAKRLQSEGYDSVISVSEITDNLGNVLKAGLSGTVAEEFAYMATILNKAIPTEDFFAYAETYASIAANAIAAGKSQQEAIDYANDELQSFANNLLYASRDLAGGFSTGLKSASNLLSSATKIAQTSRTGDISDISGVLTSVSAIVGAVAPDLASSLVDSIVSAATGGNAENVTALRTLAGGGASNTAFLQQFASNPQAVFATLFRNLGSMQNMSSENYMEVAEGLSSIFGVSMDALARVDFNYLADAVDGMNTDSTALSKNMELLVSGQTTSTAEQLKAQEINRTMIEEGLTYVLDNDAARTIQQHMWDEQIANDLKESEFAVNLQGKALEFMQSILNGVTNILSFLNPIAWLKKGANLIATMDDISDMSADITTMLEAQKVGQGNSDILYNMTTQGKDLDLVPNYLERIGQYGRYGSSAGVLDNIPLVGDKIGTQVNKLVDSKAGQIVTGVLGVAGNLMATDYTAAVDGFNTTLDKAGKAARNALWGTATSSGGSGGQVSSAYSWGNVSKSSLASSVGGKYDGSSAFSTVISSAGSAISSVQAEINKASQDRMQSYLDSMQSYVGEHKSYEDWAAAASDYGITDLGAALEDYGMTEADVMDQFQNLETEAGVQALYEENMLEQKFWEDAIQWYEEEYPLLRDETWPIYTETLFGYLTSWNETMWPDFNTKLFEAVDEWRFTTWPAYLNDLDLKHTEIMDMQNVIADLSDSILTESIKLNKQFQFFFEDWTSYYIEHEAYSKATWNAYDVGSIRSQERAEAGDAVLTLAQALTANAVDFKDPQVQTNVLLSKILLVAEAIMQQGNDTTTVSLPTALSALGLGVTSESI